MNLMDADANDRIAREAASLEVESRGDTIITMGEILLWFDLILICFIEIGLRTGSRLFLWWVIAEGVLGLVLVAIGMHHKSMARRDLTALEP
jgi:pheromone shutdown protein TraB